MKIVVFGPEKRVGALAGDAIIDLNRADPDLPCNLAAFIAGGAPMLKAAAWAVENAAPLDANGVKLHAPWPGKRIAMVGGNFADHLAGMIANQRGEAINGDMIQTAYAEARKKGQWGFWKVLDEVAGPGDEVPYPRERTRYFDYEGEIAIVIGKRGKNIRAEDVAEYVWGITLANDWSIRDNVGPGGGTSYNLSKTFDFSSSLGPCIAVGEGDFQATDCETRVNGELRQRYNTRDMIFKFGEVLEFLSRGFTFVPGDIISGGTAAGTAADRTRRGPDGVRSTELFLKPGDRVEISSPQIGMLGNTVF